jgi:hypothetical protein
MQVSVSPDWRVDCPRIANRLTESDEAVVSGDNDSADPNLAELGNGIGEILLRRFELRPCGV